MNRRGRQSIEWPSAVLLLVGLVCTPILGGCRRGGAEAGIVVAGSTSVQPVAELIADHYQLSHPSRPVSVQGGGSTAGVRAAETGTADIGMSSRNLKPEEQEGLSAILIARDAIVPIVHPTNPLRALTKDQLRAIFAGDITNWSQLGARSAAMTVVTREEGSGTRGAFEEMVMGEQEISVNALVQDSTGTVRAIVASDPNGIGYISFGMVNEEVAAVSVDGIMPTHASVAAGEYKLSRPFLFLTKGEPTEPAQHFIDYVLGEAGQALIEHEGYIAVREHAG